MTREQLLSVARSILFNTETVRAILDGRKTVTRRVVKGLPDCNLMYLETNPSVYTEDNPDKERTLNGLWAIFESCGDEYEECPMRKSAYKVGDILYVRETFHQNYDGSYAYKAYSPTNSGWSPSIHMPKEAARIFLRVTDVRVERLQDITEEQAKNEGISEQEIIKAWNSVYKHKGGFTEKISENLIRLFGTDSHIIYVFKNLWNSTIKKQDLNRYDWDANPWVWVYELERVIEDA